MSTLRAKTKAGVTGILLVSVLGTAPALGAPDDSVQVNVQDAGNGIYMVKGSFTVPAESTSAWRVLTDYDQLGTFIPSMHSSIVKKPDANTVLVSQETTTYFLSIPKRTHVLLQVQEEPGSRIDFTDVSQADFELYKGSWQLEKTPGGTRVEYEASARPKINVPIWGRSIFLGAVKNLMGSLRKEILRRESGTSS